MPRVLSVGQCGFDAAALSHHLRKVFRVEVVAARNFSEAHAALGGGGFDLVLINRVTDQDGTLGLDLVRMLKADPAYAGLAVMLVSNYADAQAEAEALGALPGFGKSELASAKARSRLEAVFEAAEAEG